MGQEMVNEEELAYSPSHTNLYVESYVSPTSPANKRSLFQIQEGQDSSASLERVDHLYDAQRKRKSLEALGKEKEEALAKLRDA
jgi:hypothetical protein